MIGNEKVVSVRAYLRKKRLAERAKTWEETLPPASQRYRNLVFLCPEDQATKERELLFRRLDFAAEQNRQTLVISDCHYSRGGLYVVIDEIGGAVDNPIDIDELVENWCNRDDSGDR